MLAGNVCSLTAAAPRRARGAHCAARRFIDTDVTHRRRPTGPDGRRRVNDDVTVTSSAT